MIDLKKPLEGVPGLLLMATLILFGATIGISVALVFTWIPMSGEVASFLGGVVGAALGAALAVMGAVYVQRKDASDRARRPSHVIARKLYWLRRWIGVSLFLWDGMKAGGGEHFEAQLPGLLQHLNSIDTELEEFPDGDELPWEVHQEVLHAKELVRWFTGSWRAHLSRLPISQELPQYCWQTQRDANSALERLKRHFPTFVPAIEVDL